MLIITMGLPGSGKGTVALNLKETYDFEIIATGEMLRSEIYQKTDLGKKVAEQVYHGDLIDDEIVNKYIEERLKGKKDIIIDGYPRNLAQAEFLNELLNYNGLSIDRVLYFDSDATQDIQRLAGRRVCTQCHSIFNTQSAPPKEAGICDNCQSELIWRQDDHPENLSHKIDLYRQHTKPLKDYYQELGLLTTIDATKSMMDVYYDVLASSTKFTVRSFK